MELKQALEELRKGKKRKFDQTLDLIINLKGINIRKDNISLIIDIPHKFKDKKVCGFLTEKNELVKTVTKPEFPKYKDKAALKELIDNFDFFIAHASLMPSVATTFGKALGPAGKMPSPQLGIITKETPEMINPLLERISKSIKIRAKEASIKIAVGKENMKDEQLMENLLSVYNSIIQALPNNIENVKNVNIKFTMGKLLGVEIK
ncbi:hypothetical protein CXT76_02240 [Candidatus Parvarchaeota archaeon]|nr:MAG: hypothetical protein CXX78_01040 [Candidatus Parvarchaeota archaeon]RZD30576.1 MAG: hypothetical protein CXT76_02240 [Candidatus Parvarchaeota archaeon]HIG52309.1 hypothetical protein [Candidatus Pacearchaeota archaeon]